MSWHCLPEQAAGFSVDRYVDSIRSQRARSKNTRAATSDRQSWHGGSDVITGGFPCQDISSAGRGVGIAGTRSGLWFEMLRIIGEVRPSFVFAENSPNLRTRGLGVVVQGLTGLGYDVRWCVLGAWHAGAPHRRNRMWIYAADANGSKQGRRDESQRCVPERVPIFARDGAPGVAPGVPCNVANADRAHGEGRRLPWRGEVEYTDANVAGDGWHPWQIEPALDRVAHGVDSRVDRLRALGNGQVPAVAAMAWQILHGADQ